MNVVLETLYLRHPRFEYISPAICEAIFSGSGSPGIVLDPIARLRGPTGGVLGGNGAGASSRLFWASYPGVLCYSVWTASDPENPDSPYNLASECVNPHSIVLCSPGFYQITAVTAGGETEKSSPIEVPGEGYTVIPLPSYPGTICYQLYKSFTLGGPSALYWSCFSGDGINVQTCGPCVKVSAITAEGESPLSEAICPEEPCDITDPEIGQELCGPLLDWNQALCACVPCEPPTPCVPGTHWDNTICQCVSDGGGNNPNNMVLSGPDPVGVCSWEYYSGTISVTNATSPVTWSITAGSVPVDLTFHGGGTNDDFVLIDGWLETPGDSTFTVKCEDADGYFVEKEFTIIGLDIDGTQVPAAEENVPYSYTLQASGGTGHTWVKDVGTFPTGLSLNSATGEISGTCATAQNQLIGVMCTNAEGLSCHFYFNMAVTLPTRSINWGNTQWVTDRNVVESGETGGTAVVSPDEPGGSGATTSATLTGPLRVIPIGQTICTADMTGTCSIPRGKTCTAYITIDSTWYGPDQPNAGVGVYVDGVQQWQSLTFDNYALPVTIPFTIAANTNPIDVTIMCSAAIFSYQTGAARGVSMTVTAHN